MGEKSPKHILFHFQGTEFLGFSNALGHILVINLFRIERLDEKSTFTHTSNKILFLSYIFSNPPLTTKKKKKREKTELSAASFFSFYFQYLEELKFFATVYFKMHIYSNSAIKYKSIQGQT